MPAEIHRIYLVYSNNYSLAAVPRLEQDLAKETKIIYNITISSTQLDNNKLIDSITAVVERYL
jgi:hypothetical protein